MLRPSVAGLMAIAALSGCAQGALAPATPNGSDASIVRAQPGRTGPDGGVATSGSPLEAENSDDYCAMGQTEACPCGDGGMGVRYCGFDPRSPTGGLLGECLDCVFPEPVTPDAGAPKDAGAPDAGNPGDVPIAGSAMTGGTSAATGGTAAPPPPPPPPPPPTKTCPSLCLDLGACNAFGPFPCCNTNTGVCGCTWAPGGYCL